MKQQLNTVVKPFDTEVDLFRKMADILNNSYNSTPSIYIPLVKETHGTKGHVTFNSHYFTHCNPIKKEIADLLFIVHNPSIPQIRICFLQAKYHKRNLPFPSFSADIKQWDLLFHRYPLLKLTKNMHFPQNILSFTQYRSITAYGIFFKDLTHQIDMIYTIPDFLNPFDKKSKLYFYPIPLLLCPYQEIPFTYCPEHIFSPTIDHFVYHLLKGKVGAPIQGYSTICHWLLNILQCAQQHIHNKQTSNDKQSSILERIFNTLKKWNIKENRTEINMADNLPFSIFLIETN